MVSFDLPVALNCIRNLEAVLRYSGHGILDGVINSLAEDTHRAGEHWRAGFFLIQRVVCLF